MRADENAHPCQIRLPPKGLDPAAVSSANNGRRGLGLVEREHCVDHVFGIDHGAGERRDRGFERPAARAEHRQLVDHQRRRMARFPTLAPSPRPPVNRPPHEQPICKQLFEKANAALAFRPIAAEGWKGETEKKGLLRFIVETPEGIWVAGSEVK